MKRFEIEEREELYIFNWANNPKRKTMKNRVCRILSYGRLNSIMIEFTDNNQIEIVSRNSVRKFS